MVRPWFVSPPSGSPPVADLHPCRQPRRWPCPRWGGLVIVPLLALAAIPVVLTILMAMGWLLACGLGLWALIKAWAGFEPWMDSDSRFQQ